MKDESKKTVAQASKLVESIVNHAIDGVGPLCGAEELALQYKNDPNYNTMNDRIDALVRWETTKSATNGFITGAGGLVTLPISVPWAVYASWVIQARLIATIAELCGRSTRDDKVRTFVLLMLLGDAAKEVLREVGVKIANQAGEEMIKRIPGRLLIEINKRVGFRLLAKTGEKALIRLAKVVPLAGGVVSAAFEGSATYSVGRGAAGIFSESAQPLAA